MCTCTHNQAGTVTYILTVFTLLLISFIIGAPLKDQTVYDSLSATCSLVNETKFQKYSNFVKECGSLEKIISFSVNEEPKITDTDTIFCLLLFNSLNTSCPNTTDVLLDFASMENVNICKTLPQALDEIKWKQNLSVAFKNEDTCRGLCIETSDLHRNICVVSQRIIYYGISQQKVLSEIKSVDHEANKDNKDSIQAEPLKNPNHHKNGSASSAQSKNSNVSAVAVLEKAAMDAGNKTEKTIKGSSENHDHNIPAVVVSAETKGQEVGTEDRAKESTENEISNTANVDSSNLANIESSNAANVNPDHTKLETKPNEPSAVVTKLDETPGKNDAQSDNKPESKLEDPSDDDIKLVDSSNINPEVDNEGDNQDYSEPGNMAPAKEVDMLPDNIGSYPLEMDGDSYFFSYFVIICLIFVLGYVVYHNKQKLLALIVEGRQGKQQYRSRRPNSASYHKLDSNLEEAISSSCNKNTSNIIY